MQVLRELAWQAPFRHLSAVLADWGSSTWLEAGECDASLREDVGTYRPISLTSVLGKAVSALKGNATNALPYLGICCSYVQMRINVKVFRSTLCRPTQGWSQPRTHLGLYRYECNQNQTLACQITLYLALVLERVSCFSCIPGDAKH